MPLWKESAPSSITSLAAARATHRASSSERRPRDIVQEKTIAYTTGSFTGNLSHSTSVHVAESQHLTNQINPRHHMTHTYNLPRLIPN